MAKRTTTMTLRLPSDIHDDLAEVARGEDRSLNLQIVSILRNWLAERRASTPQPLASRPGMISIPTTVATRKPGTVVSGDEERRRAAAAQNITGDESVPL